MASSFQTLVKILRLEQQKGHQNKAVIGGFARFAQHWAREANGKASSAVERALIEQLAARLREYDVLAEELRPAEVESIIALAASQPVQTEKPPRRTKAETAESAPADDSEPRAESGMDDTLPETPLVESMPIEEPAPTQESRPTPSRREPVVAPRSVRERRGYARTEAAAVAKDIEARLDEPLTGIKGIGDKRAALLEKLNLKTKRDALFNFPRRHDDYSRLKIIQQLVSGEEVSVIGMLSRLNIQRTRQGHTRVEAYLEDESGALRLNWFNQPWLEKRIKEGTAMVASGKIEQYLGRLVMNGPEIEPLDQEWLLAGRIVPVYRLTKGIYGKFMRRLHQHIVGHFARRLPDVLPLAVREDADLMDYGDAVGQAHFPDSQEDLAASKFRLAFDELFQVNLAMLRQRHTWQSNGGTPLAVEDDWVSAFAERLPYQLTDAQWRAVADIRLDMGGDLPMNRLLQGDVGSGKTVVAALAMGIAVAGGMQSALMAPTGILAEQHFANLSAVYAASPLAEGLNIALLTGSTPAGDRKAILRGLADGSVHIVVGTHALLQSDVNFSNLGLAVIDEQHRFGVTQRGVLRDKAATGSPHLLVMTATPIPRTLALTMHADLDLTVIDEMPPGRQPVQTRVLQPKERERAFAFIRSQIEQGRQAFVIFPLIEESDKLNARAASAEYKRLQEKIFPTLRLGLLHGRMKAADKEAVMAAFYAGETHILVSTSVVEVGIDVPNASVMLVENATRFGLAQLHQLRGRVGRGADQSYCLLMSDQPFLDGDERLKAMEGTTDGFELAQIDWEMRGAGDLLGVRQSGFGRLRWADLMDSRLVDLVQRQARAVYERDTELALPEHKAIAERIGAFQRGDIS